MLVGSDNCAVCSAASDAPYMQKRSWLHKKYLASRLHLREMSFQCGERNRTLYRNRKSCPVVFYTHYFTFTHKVDWTSGMFSLDAHDEGHRCMLRNHCSTFHQKSIDAHVFADSFDLGYGVEGPNRYVHRALHVEATVLSLLLVVPIR